MPVSTSSSVLTGQDGSAWFKPAGTTVNLLDWADFQATTGIIVPSTSDFKVGDPVKFSEIDGANIDSAITPLTNTYYVVAIVGNKVSVSATKGGAAITLTGDGGTGTANTPGGYITMEYADYAAVCDVRSWQLDLSRAEIDVTALRCGLTTGGDKLAPFRKKQSGYADGSGQMDVMFSRDQSGLANRLLTNSLLRVQDGAYVKLYLDLVANALGTAPDDVASSFIEMPVNLNGMAIQPVTTEDQPIMAQVKFAAAGPPKHLFYNSLS